MKTSPSRKKMKYPFESLEIDTLFAPIAMPVDGSITPGQALRVH